MNIVAVLLIVILIVLWIITGVIITQANILLRQYKDLDVYFSRAHSYTLLASFITWFLVASFIIIVILAVVGVGFLFTTGVGEAGAAEAAVAVESQGGVSAYTKPIKDHVSGITIAILILAIALVAFNGILATFAARNVERSPNYNSSDENMHKIRTDCILTASLCLGVVGILVIAVIAYLVISHRKPAAVAVAGVK